jgi:hypothetical protein
MKRAIAIFLPALMLAASAVSAMDDELAVSHEAECHKYAAEDEISPEDMDTYIEGCVRDLTESAKASGLSPSDTVEHQE